MMKAPKLFFTLANCMMLAACASGPKFSDASNGIPKIPDGDGRVYFYRTSIVGLAVQPMIDLNGQQVSRCAPNGVFVADVPPGNYEASIATEVEHKLTFTVDAGEEKFVRCYISMGFLVGHGNVELVDPTEGRADIQGLSFTGKTSISAPTASPAAAPSSPASAPSS